MDFNLSLAHFCELHGPVTVICTQTLPVECSECYPESISVTPDVATTDHEPSSWLHLKKDRRIVGFGGCTVRNNDSCASCRMSLPEEIPYGGRSINSSKAKVDRHECPSLRTKEEVHICDQDSQYDTEEIYWGTAIPTSRVTSDNHQSCHSHDLTYVSGSSPSASDAFSTLRRATLRTLSGEQLPRGQTSGPLWFGDPNSGYTIAYLFRLEDLHARGRQRYYALIALAGHDTQRAFEAAPLIWNFFEQTVNQIVRSAETAVTFSDGGTPPDTNDTVPPVSSFLTGRTVEVDSYSRRTATNVRANGIAELVNNENFFCELHLLFAGMLQELGKHLGGAFHLAPAGSSTHGKGKQGNIAHQALQPEDSPHLRDRSYGQRSGSEEWRTSSTSQLVESVEPLHRRQSLTSILGDHRPDIHV